MPNFISLAFYSINSCYIIERVKHRKNWQINNYDHSFERSRKTTRFKVLKLIFVKCLIQRIPLDHYVRFNLNNLKVLEHQNYVQRTQKGDFFYLKQLRKLYLFRLKNGQNAEIGFANHILSKRFKSSFWYYDIDL